MEERFRLIYLSREGTGIKQVSLSRNKFGICLVLLTVFFGGIIAFMLGLFTRLYQNYQIVNLENNKEYLEKELLVQKERVASLSVQLGEIETVGDELRTVANLPLIDSDTRLVGVGGPSYLGFSDIDYYSNDVSRTAVENDLDLDRVERGIQLEKSSLSEIAAKLKAQEDWLDHFPSIIPVLGGYVLSKFGWRIDPFIRKNAIHEGIDYAAAKGTTVLATAGGVVKLAQEKYTPFKSYGKYIIIDHGNGYETLYAHLLEINVRQGQKVERWDPIGKSGDTGRAEGYHLHYEVRENGVNVNPDWYVLDTGL
ncbi:M23 family metallopeptidase [bacterium]|nr:M23 family metallopeptidase [bacterium]